MVRSSCFIQSVDPAVPEPAPSAEREAARCCLGVAERGGHRLRDMRGLTQAGSQRGEGHNSQRLVVVVRQNTHATAIASTAPK